jgi:hypothetical protein
VIKLSSKQAREKCHQTLVAGLRLIRPEERVTAIAAPVRRPIHLMACIRDARNRACSPDVKEVPASVSPGPPVSIEAEAQSVARHNPRISRVDYRQVRNALGKLLTCRRKPDS